MDDSIVVVIGEIEVCLIRRTGKDRRGANIICTGGLIVVTTGGCIKGQTLQCNNTWNRALGKWGVLRRISLTTD